MTARRESITVNEASVVGARRWARGAAQNDSGTGTFGPVRASTLSRCLWLNAFALAFSLMHVMGDFALVARLAPDPFWIQGIFVAFAAFLYGWWGWSLARVGRDSRSGLVRHLTPFIRT